jgi:outer membrane protein assembly factor BamB
MIKQRQVVRTRNRFLEALLVTLVFLPVCVAQGQEWTRFRGPDGQGISRGGEVPVKWTDTDYNWKLVLPGGGHGSPVLWADKVFVTCGDEETGRGILLALRASDGEVLWQKESTQTTYRMNRLNSYATTTPAVDADHVYVLWATTEETILAAFDHEGTEVWTRTLEGVHCQHGPGSSPIVLDEIVVFTHEHEGSGNEPESAWIAVDRRTGRTRWKLPRQNSPKTSYSTPCVYRPPTGAPQLVFTSRAHGMTGVDPDTGKVLWEFESACPSRVVSSPVIADGLLIGTCGDGSSGKCLVAVRPGTSDKAVPATQAYKIEGSTTPYVPTSLAKDGLLFTFHDRGQVSCLRSATGAQIWREKPAGRFFGSPVWVGGKLYCITMDGEVVVIRAGDEYELLAVNPLGEKSHATPAVAGGRMYLRTYSHLFCIGPKKEQIASTP